jgi:hypothetical protein
MTLNNTCSKIFKFVFFSLQPDESTDLVDVSQLLIFIWMIFSDGNIKEGLLKTILLHGNTGGEDTFKACMLALWT